jgi:hypothetical protein
MSALGDDEARAGGWASAAEVEEWFGRLTAALAEEEPDGEGRYTLAQQRRAFLRIGGYPS